MLKLLAKPVAEKILADVQLRTKAFVKKYQMKPKLSVILVGDDPASVIYTQRKGEMAGQLGMDHETIRLPENSTVEDVKARVASLNSDPTVHGILIQRPLPKEFHEQDVLLWVTPEKDVDAFHPIHAGKLMLEIPSLQPCTPAGIMELLRYYGIEIEGKVACIIGRSSIVGKPIASLLMQANATVIQCHSKTRNLSQFTRQADLLVVAAGKRELIQGSDIKPGAVVIDVGIHRTQDHRIVGDVSYAEVAPLASAISPVPGGVGPMTIALLMRNTIFAAEKLHSQSN